MVLEVPHIPMGHARPGCGGHPHVGDGRVERVLLLHRRPRPLALRYLCQCGGRCAKLLRYRGK